MVYRDLNILTLVCFLLPPEIPLLQSLTFISFYREKILWYQTLDLLAR